MSGATLIDGLQDIHHRLMGCGRGDMQMYTICLYELMPIITSYFKKEYAKKIETDDDFRRFNAILKNTNNDLEFHINSEFGYPYFVSYANKVCMELLRIENNRKKPMIRRGRPPQSKYDAGTLSYDGEKVEIDEKTLMGRLCEKMINGSDDALNNPVPWDEVYMYVYEVQTVGFDDLYKHISKLVWEVNDCIKDDLPPIFKFHGGRKGTVKRLY